MIAADDRGKGSSGTIVMGGVDAFRSANDREKNERYQKQAATIVKRDRCIPIGHRSCKGPLKMIGQR